MVTEFIVVLRNRSMLRVSKLSKIEGSMFEAKGGDKVTVPDAMIRKMQDLYEARQIIPSLQNQVKTNKYVSESET